MAVYAPMPGKRPSALTERGVMLTVRPLSATSESMAKANRHPGKHLTAPRPVESLIRVVRGQKVMLDSDLAVLYQVLTKNLNLAVRRNLAGFLKTSCFNSRQLRRIL
jgi:hypothetical protein